MGVEEQEQMVEDKMNQVKDLLLENVIEIENGNVIDHKRNRHMVMMVQY